MVKSFFTFVWCFVRDGRGSFSFMAFLLTLIARRSECGILNDVIAVTTQRTSCRSLHACGARGRRWWWQCRWPIIDGDVAAVTAIRHRTAGNADATYAILVTRLTRTLILAVAHVRQEALVQCGCYHDCVFGGLADKCVALELLRLLIVGH